ncbi:MAG: ammonium transporter [Microthrixaceae bacterium]|nr:ammonium transporter [Microthrixaceae bacterium]
MDGATTAWLLVCSALVIFMTPGLAFFYGGMDRSRNSLNMLMMNFWSLLVVPLVWAVLGYSLAFGGSGSLLGNLDSAFLSGTGIGADQGESLVWLVYLGAFAAITPALISGAVADRMKFSAWAVFVPLWSLLVYVPVTFWIYGGTDADGALTGWLATRGSLDFAGGTAIHVNAGIAALAAVVVLGRRKGWPSEGHPPHSMPLVMIGTAILLFGWFGFNSGAGGLTDGVAIQAFANTFLAAAAGGFAWALTERVKDGHFTNLGVASGMVAGLVAITPAAGFVSGMSPIWIGLAAGVVCAFAVGLKFSAGFDDSLDVVGVHMVGGLVGSLLIGLFANPGALGDFEAGLLNGGGAGLLLEQFIANAVTIVFSFAVTFAILKVLDLTMGIRASEDDELTGLDVSQHAETAYNLAESTMAR